MTESSVRGVCVDLDDTLFAQEEWLAGAWAAVADRADDARARRRCAARGR